MTPVTVLLIGDSIVGGFGDTDTGGYAPLVRSLLGQDYQVTTLPANGEDSRRLLAHLDDWLGIEVYDLIHFNCGLHDIKRARAGGTPQVSLTEYEANLRQLVNRLRGQSCQLIWARITPVRDGQPHPQKDFDRYNLDIDAYNAIADRVMAEADLPVDDLYATVVGTDVEQCLSWDGVHMTDLGNRVLAIKVAAMLHHLTAGTMLKQKEAS